MGAGTVRLALIQMRCAADPAANRIAAEARVEDAARRGAQIVCLQELFLTRYFCQSEDVERFQFAEPIPGPTTEWLGALSARLGVVIVGPLFERRAAGVYHNSAVVLDADGSLVGTYRKMHIPDDPLYYEKYYFTPGDLGFPSFQTRFGKIGVLICWDQWFPEAARLTALAGADILLYPTAIGWHPREKEQLGEAQHAAWETVQRGHAIANGVYVAAVNRVGVEGDLEFWGASFVSDPFGRILHRASHESEESVVVEIDLSAVDKTRRLWPFLRDRRIDSYQDLLRRVRD